MTHRMQWRERFQRTLQLWPYMAPLALVYFAEYVLQVRIMPANLHDAIVLLFLSTWLTNFAGAHALT